jgi:hypothetical protein
VAKATKAEPAADGASKPAPAGHTPQTAQSLEQLAAAHLAPVPEPVPGPEGSPSPADLPDFEVIRTRGEEPSQETPITYREVALGVRPDATRGAVEALLRVRFASVLKEIAERPRGKFVQLAVFDHVFAKKPIRPPVATLLWKDWRGDPVLAFPGFAKDTIRPEAEPIEEPAIGSLRPTSVIPVDETTGSVPPPPRDDQSSAYDGAERAAGAEVAPAAASDDGRISSPDTSNRRSSSPGKRDSISDDLIGRLFDKMHDLHFMTDVRAGADFVLNVLKQTLPSTFAIVQVFDINSKNFVVVRQHGANDRALLFQTPDTDDRLRSVMRSSRSAHFEDLASGEPLGRWAAAGVVPDSLLCGPVKQGGRYLGIIELGNVAGAKGFTDDEANALDYICEQFAEFLTNRPIVLDADVILK